MQAEKLISTLFCYFIISCFVQLVLYNFSLYFVLFVCLLKRWLILFQTYLVSHCYPTPYWEDCFTPIGFQNARDHINKPVEIRIVAWPFNPHLKCCDLVDFCIDCKGSCGSTHEIRTSVNEDPGHVVIVPESQADIAFSDPVYILSSVVARLYRNLEPVVPIFVWK